MNISIRNAIKENFKDSNSDEISQAINDAIATQNEKALPGLGVLLEIIWQSSDQEFKNKMLEKIHL